MFVSGDSYSIPVLQMGNGDFLQEACTFRTREAGNRIWDSTRNDKSCIQHVKVTFKKQLPVHTVSELRKIHAMINWCLTEGNYMSLHPQWGYVENKYMCLILGHPNPQHSFTIVEADMCIEYIMEHLHACCGGALMSVAAYVMMLADQKLTQEEMRDAALKWYQLLLNKIDTKINQLEQEAA